MNSRMLGYEYSSPGRVRHDRSFGSPNGTVRNLEGTTFSPLGRSLSQVFRTEPLNASPNRSITGPLLTSMSFNSNLSTYMDSKSPGLAERVVQYKNEAHKPCVTHQAKYSSPGVFPVVHLSKKDIPMRTILPNHKVTVRLAPPDIYQPYRSDYRTSESCTQAHSSDLSKGSGDSLKTHNVLDALRKLSRKRIHSTEEYGLELSNKRRCSEIIQTEAVVEKQPANVAESNDDMPCVISAMDASLTSSDLQMIRKLNKEESNSVEKQPKRQCTIETQTDNIPEPPKKITILSNEVVRKATKSCKESLQVDKPEVELVEIINNSENSIGSRHNIFKNLSYAEMKKEKLQKYLSAFPTDTVSTPPSENNEEPKEITVEAEPIASIISVENKTKHNKHVTFDLPQKEEVDNILKSASPITSPVSKITTNEDIQKPSLEVKTNNLPKFGEFDAPKTTPTIQNDLFKPSPPALTESKINAPMSTSPKLGGFKFDFKNEKTVSSTPSPAQTTNLFNILPSTSIVNTNNSNGGIGLSSPQLGTNTSVTSVVNQSAIFSTGLEITPIKENTASTNAFLPTQNIPTPALTFGAVVNSTSTTSPLVTPTFGALVTTSTPNTNKLNFGTTISANNPFTSKFEPPPSLSATTSATLYAPTTTSTNSGNTFVFGGETSFNQPPPLEAKPPAFGKTVSSSNIFTSNDNSKTNTFKFGETSKQSTFGNAFTFGADNTKNEPITKPLTFETPVTTKPQMDLFKFGTSSTAGSQTFEAISAPSLFSASSVPNFNATPTLSTKPPPYSPPSFNPPPMSLFNNSPLPNNPPPAFNLPTVPAPSFNMTQASASVPAALFNSAPNNMFGSVPNTMFATTPNANYNPSSLNSGPLFGAPSSSGMFNIGSGSSTPRSRTTLKARRRT